MNFTSVYDSEQNLSNLAEKLFEHFVLCLTVITIFGNIVTFFVYNSKELSKNTISFYFRSNSVVAIILMSALSSHVLYSWFKPHSASIFFCQILNALLSALFNGFSFISMFAALDRLRFIIYPTSLKFVEKRLFQWLLLSITIILLIGIYIPDALNVVPSDKGCLIISLNVKSIFNWVFFSLYALVPSIITAGCSIHLIISIDKTKYSRRHSNTKRTQLVLNILVINAIFSITMLLRSFSNTLIFVMLTYFNEFYWLNWGKINLIILCGDITELLNYACPIFIHLMTNKLFVQVIKKALKMKIDDIQKSTNHANR